MSIAMQKTPCASDSPAAAETEPAPVRIPASASATSARPVPL